MNATLEQQFSQGIAERNAQAERDRQQREADQVEALARYRELLSRRHEPHEGDIEATREAQKTLGLSDDEVTADLAAVKRARELKPRVLTREQREQIEADVEAARQQAFTELARLAGELFATTKPQTAAQFLCDSLHKFFILGDQRAGSIGGGVTSAAWTFGGVESSAQASLANSEGNRLEIDRIKRENPRVFG